MHRWKGAGQVTTHRTGLFGARFIRQTVWGSVIVLVLTSGLSGQIASAARSTNSPTTMVWSLAKDFRLSPSQANPAPDKYGNTGVWSYLQSAGVTHDPATYSLLTGFETNEVGTSGLEDWYGVTCGYGGCYPHIGRNGTGRDQLLNSSCWDYCYPTLLWPAGTLLLHPYTTNMAVVGWTSPVTATVSMVGSLRSAQLINCGTGIQWTIDNGATTVATGHVLPPLPFVQSFRIKAGVQAGQTYYLTIAAYNESVICDSTLTAWTIKTT
jgi:hypothetical protein